MSKQRVRAFYQCEAHINPHEPRDVRVPPDAHLQEEDLGPCCGVDEAKRLLDSRAGAVVCR
eukprot:scaffold8721_cov80-Phaeocystis_antarctica.AAC.31